MGSIQFVEGPPKRHCKLICKCGHHLVFLIPNSSLRFLFHYPNITQVYTLQSLYKPKTAAGPGLQYPHEQIPGTSPGRREGTFGRLSGILSRAPTSPETEPHWRAKVGSSWFGNRVQGSWCGCFSTLGPIRSLKMYSTRGRVRIPVVCSPEATVYARREGLCSSGMHGLKTRFYPDDGQVRRFPVTPYIFAALAHRRSCLPSSGSGKSFNVRKRESCNLHEP